MLRNLVAAIFLLCTIPASPQASSPVTKLTLNLAADPNEGAFPQTFTITLTNATDHDIRLATPYQNCDNSYAGTIWIRMKFTPLPSATEWPEIGSGCVADVGVAGNGPPSILDRAKGWKVLHPGEKMELTSVKLPASPGQTSAVGIYTFWATYTPPGMSREDAELLHENNIDFQATPLESAQFTFTKITP